MDYTDIQIALSKNRYASMLDKKLFEMWEDKKITTPQCMHQFYKNNKIHESYYISTSLFESWLRSLGYIRE